MAINRLLALSILLALAITQALFALHRGSSGPLNTHQKSTLHTGLFAQLEQSDRADLGHAGDHSRACDSLDHQLSLHGPGSAATQACFTCGQPSRQMLAPPSRLSSYQRHGPPTRGPPVTLSV